MLPLWPWISEYKKLELTYCPIQAPWHLSRNKFDKFYVSGDSFFLLGIRTIQCLIRWSLFQKCFQKLPIEHRNRFSADDTNIRSFVIVTQIPEAHHFFFSLISLCSLDWVISTDLCSSSFIHYHYSVITFLLLIPFSEFVVSVTVFLVLKFPVSSSLYFCFFAQTFYWEVCFKCVYNCSLKCFMML